MIIPSIYAPPPYFYKIFPGQWRGRARNGIIPSDDPGGIRAGKAGETVHDQLLEKIIARAAYLSSACGVESAAFELYSKSFAGRRDGAFCAGCTDCANGKCNPLNTHLYGCFESERWNGLYIYYCPMGLVFVATSIYADDEPAYGIITGPIVMGLAADVLSDNGGAMAEQILKLPEMEPARVTGIAQTQWAVAMFLSGRSGQRMELSDEMKTRMLNTLYDVTEDLRKTADYSYPMEIERRLQQMILHGEKREAQELINQMLGHLYFNSSGDFETIKQRAVELVVLFSRASIEGGADVKQIFGLNQDIYSQIGAFQTLDELSAFLTAIFHRFVGYVFDFEHVKHVDVLHKAVDYIRQNYMKKISLDDVANHVYLSKSYLSKIFKDEMNCSFTNYVNTLRVEKCKELLTEKAVSLADIAALVGFDDQSYFTKVFRKATGVSPGQYRKSGGKK